MQLIPHNHTIFIYAPFHFESLKPLTLHINNSSSNDSSFTLPPWNELDRTAGNTGTLKSWDSIYGKTRYTTSALYFVDRTASGTRADLSRENKNVQRYLNEYFGLPGLLQNCSNRIFIIILCFIKFLELRL